MHNTAFLSFWNTCAVQQIDRECQISDKNQIEWDNLRLSPLKNIHITLTKTTLALLYRWEVFSWCMLTLPAYAKSLPLPHFFLCQQLGNSLESTELFWSPSIINSFTIESYFSGLNLMHCFRTRKALMNYRRTRISEVSPLIGEAVERKRCMR